MKSLFKPDPSKQNKEQDAQIKEINISSKEEKDDSQQKQDQRLKKRTGTGLSLFAKESKKQQEDMGKDDKQKDQKSKDSQKKAKQTIKLEDLRFILSKDRSLVSSLGNQFKSYIKNQQIYIQKELKNINFCRQKIIAVEEIETTKLTFEKYCNAQELSLKQLSEFISFLQNSAIPSVNYLLEQVRILEFLINDFEIQLKELFTMDENIQKFSQEEGKQNEILQLQQAQEKLAINAEYSGTKLKNKLQIYVKDRNDEVRELVLHLNKCKVNYHGQSLTFFSTFFFDILMYDQIEEVQDQKLLKEKLQQKQQKAPVKSYKKQCKKILKEYLKEKNVDKYIPDSDEEEFDMRIDTANEPQKEIQVSDDDQSVNNDQNGENQFENQENKPSIAEDKLDPIIEKMNLDHQIEKTKEVPKVKSVLRLSKLQL
ncbi:hypothetical protein TTHERM_00157830 (macronuclear) [Tetrahymena thermophila SB210]|uniref:Uncharacterized protein n=1 Tax=Tetrahymena thermophila (strain SB210) TaxID=312017 RepID=Q22WF1_TETTS|nr:hypothetical protein TTHERM_00157830 [Tetrahymena thermophila SB210]EAR89466.2 hypothetical protein TTHERM_00157830 [Tetrahymena thermophila SB210]|eukprot:XP_001009711.2 hypothetical protein TTHERM_00157830 [Tetrahymena thermophila SB210]